MSKMEREMQDLRVENRELPSRVLSKIRASSEVDPQASGRAPLRSPGAGVQGAQPIEERPPTVSRTATPATEPKLTGGRSEPVPQQPRPPVRQATHIPRAPIDNVYSVQFLKEIDSVAEALRLFKSGLNGRESIESLKAKNAASKEFRFADKSAIRKVSRLNTLIQFVQDKVKRFGMTVEEAIKYTDFFRKTLLGEGTNLRSFIDTCPALKKKRKAEDTSEAEMDEVDGEIAAAEPSSKSALAKRKKIAKCIETVEEHVRKFEE